MSQIKTIKTTGNLRQFLADSIVAVKNGDMDADTARGVTKLAAQINESFYSEVKIARTAKELGKPAANLGDLTIG